MVFTPFKIKDIELKNRWIMLAMHTGFAEGNALTEEDFLRRSKRRMQRAVPGTAGDG